MKKVLAYFLAIMMMAAVSSCTDPNADELYDLKNQQSTTDGAGEDPTSPDNPPPGN